MKYEHVGIICAMETEAKAILAALEHSEEKKIGSLVFSTGNLGDRKVTVAVCGIGKVFAAMCAQSMILSFSPDCILNSGVAGSLTDRLSILDIAVSDHLVQHDMDTTPLGDPPGLISGINQVKFPAAPDLKKAVLRRAEDMGISALSGTIASGDQFIARKEQKERILSLFSPIACEMEGAAIAQVAFCNRVPLCVIRAISDSYSGQNEMDYAEFVHKAAARSSALLISLLSDHTAL